MYTHNVTGKHAQSHTQCHKVAHTKTHARRKVAHTKTHTTSKGSKHTNTHNVTRLHT
jgi:hypothetical protein